MSLSKTDLGWAAVPVRLALGIILLAHGGQKLFGLFDGLGIGGTADYFANIGIQPAMFWTWVVALTEFLGGAGVLVGLLTRPASLGIAAVMVAAIATVHWQNGFFAEMQGYEYNIALLGLSLCLLIGGAGALSIDGVIARRCAAPEASPPAA